jgi:hypothetical protein
VVPIVEEDVYFLGPFLSTSCHFRPKFDQPEWRLFRRSGIKGLKIQNNFLIPIWEMQAGSWALATLRHSLAHFDQFRIVLGLILVNPEWKWFLKRKILDLQIWNHIWIPIFFSTLGHSMPKFDQPRMKTIWKNWNYEFKSTKYFLDTHLRDESGFQSTRNVEAFFCPFWLNSYRFRVDFG